MMRLTIYCSFLTLLFGACHNPLVPAHWSGGQTSTSAMLYQHIDFLASDSLRGREAGTEGERIAARYIAEKMRLAGLEPAGLNGTFLQNFDISADPHMVPRPERGGSAYNVMGLLRNSGEGLIVIGGHYDHLGMGHFGSLHAGKPVIHNGADDNASGIAALLELIPALRSTDLQSDVLFIAFSAEESGLYGSNYFIKSDLGNRPDYRLMINMDMVGRYDASRGMAINGTGTSPVWHEAIETANEKLQLKLILSESGTGASDHTSFYYHDVPVLHFFTGQHADYHKPSDDIHKINFEGLEIIVNLITAIVTEADSREEIQFTKTKEEERQTTTFKVSLGVMPDYLFDGEGMRIDGVSEDRPAQRAGIQKGDIIIGLGELKVTDIYSYMDALNAHNPGDEAEVIINRNGEKIIRQVTF